MLDQTQIRVDRPTLATTAPNVAAVAARCSVDAEAARRLAPEVLEGLVDAGFARHFVPAGFGGTEGGFTEVTAAVATIGAACAASAWCASLLANLPRFAAYLPIDGQREIWADGPDTVVVGSPSPFGKAVPAPGGWRVSGTWPYISGVDYAAWTLVCGMVPGDRPTARLFAVPRREYRIVETWSNVGMQATGSNTVVVEDLFVPAARSFARNDLYDGRAADASGACHQVPLQAVNGLSFAAPVLGAATGALSAWSGFIGEKIAKARPGAPGPSRTSYEMTLARASGEIDAARLLLERACELADDSRALTPLTTMRNLRDCSLAVETMVTAVDRMFQMAGTSGQATTSPVQRFWRDVHSAASHVALQFEPAANAYAAALFDNRDE